MSLTFHHPWWLLLAAPVAVAAIVALVRPRRRRMVVASLSLWQEAFAQAAPTSARKRWADAAWLSLLAGALLAVLAAADPRLDPGAPVRHVAVEIVPSAELAGPGGLDRLRRAGRALLDRLDARDRVELLLPVGPGGGSRAFRSPAEASRALDDVRIVPLAARRVALPPPAPGVARLARLAPAPEAGAPAPTPSEIPIAPALAAVTIDAAGFAQTPSGGQLLVALRSHARSSRVATLTLTSVGEDGRRTPWATVRRDVPAGGRVAVVHSLPSGDLPAGLVAAVTTAGQGDSADGAALPGTRAYLARRQRREARVAIVGRANRSLERFVQASPRAVRVVDANGADVVFAVGRGPAGDVAALVIDPASAPTGWRRGEARGPILLARADALADDPLLADVDLAGLGIRRANPLIASAPSPWKAVVRDDGDALVLRREGSAGAARGVHLAFALDEDNTNAAVSVAWVAFLANVLDYLAPEMSGETDYRWAWPNDVAAGDATPIVDGGEALGGLSAPGLYRYADGELVGVSVVGLRGGQAAPDPAEAAGAVPLPEASAKAAEAALWPVATAGAMGLWSAVWWLRRRGQR